MKFIKNTDFLVILSLIFLSLLTWRAIPSSQFQGEGFYYFLKMEDKLNFGHIINPFLNLHKYYDTLALSLFNFIGPIFRDQVFLYMWLMLIIMLLIDTAFYILVKITTGSRLVAIVGTIFFSLSFIGKYDMYANGGYQYFVQRGILLLPLLISFIFLHLYISSNKLKYFVTSLFLYLLSITMGFFGTWFLPPFIFYPLLYLLFRLKKINLSLIKKIIWLPVPYLIGNYLIIKDSSYSFVEDSILELFFYKTSFVITGIVHQLFVTTIPIGFYKFIVELPVNVGLNIDKTIIFGIILVLLYGGGLLLIKKYSPKWIVLSLTAFFAALTMLFFNLYLNYAATLSTIGSSRYFYYPATMIALFWGLVIVTLFKIGSLKFKAGVALFVIFWAISNIYTINNEVKKDYSKHKNNRDIIVYLNKWYPQMKDFPSFIVLPSNIGAYGGEFTKRFYMNSDDYVGIEGLHQLDYQELAKNKVNPEHLFVLHYDHSSESVIDETQKWRKYLYSLENE